MSATIQPKRVSILALPSMSTGTPINGLYETLTLGEILFAAGKPDAPPRFQVEIVGPEPGVFPGACGLPLQVHRGVAEVARTDIVIAPSMFLSEGDWVKGRQPQVIDWMRQQHDAGADLCTACAGARCYWPRRDYWTGARQPRTGHSPTRFAATFRRFGCDLRNCWSSAAREANSS